MANVTVPRHLTSVDNLSEQDAAMKELLQSLGRDGGGGGGMTDESLKPRVDFLHTAFLWLAGIMVTALIAIATIILSVASAANVRTDKITEAVSGLNREVGKLGEKVDQTNRRFDDTNRRFDETNRRLDRIEGKLDKLR